jgi:ubiquinone/menaquinone biosynthesis C-methylase UbiE
MSDGDRRFTTSMAEVYERHLSSALFGPYADELARRVAASRPARVLDTATGTGLLARRLHALLPAAVIVATDLNAGMLDEAGRWDPRISWQVADAQQLPFDDESFDAVTCQFGAMFFPDRRLAYAEARRVLTPDGTYHLAIWDTVERNEFAVVLVETLQRAYPDDPSQFIQRIPHGYTDPDEIEADVRAAGFADVRVEQVNLLGRADTARDLAVGYALGTPTLAEIEARDAAGPDRFVDLLTEAFAARFGARDLVGALGAYLVSARD